MLPNKNSRSFCHIALLFSSLLMNFHQAQSASYRIEFDSQFSPPPVIPTKPQKMVYSVPLNQVISKPIIVRIKDQTNIVISPEGNPNVFIASFDVSELKGITKDKWKQTGGKLCQRTILGESWPKRLNREKYQKVCGSSSKPTVLVRKFVNDMVILDWLSHEHPTGVVPSNSRFLRISIPDLKLSADSNAFNITTPAASLYITKQPPASINANTGFDIMAEVRDATNNVITEGLDSILYVELTVPYEYKQFYHKYGKDMLLYNTEVRLGGAFAVTYQGTNDLVIRKKASRGRVHFTDVRILDVVSRFRLNLTMYMSRDPWLRTPDCPTCYADLSHKDIDHFGMVRFRPMTKSILSKTPAVTLTKEFNVLGQKLHKLILISPFKVNQQVIITRNFPFPGPLYVQAEDISRNRIYSGPHANLPLEIVTVPFGVCISVDHTTYIREGRGVLKGSICQIIRSVHLIIYSKVNYRAFANSSAFKVIGDVHLAHFGNFRFSGSGWHIEPHLNSFVRFGARDINRGIIPGVLRHFQMKIVVDTVETYNDVTRTITLYSLFRERGVNSPSKLLRTIIMPSNRKTSAAMIRDVNNDGITMLSLSQKDMEFTKYRYFNRVCWNWNQICLFFLTACKGRKWNILNILRMEDEPTPDALQDISTKNNISFNEDIEIPLFDPKYPDEDMLYETFVKVKEWQTKIIVCFVNETFQQAVLSAAYKYECSSLHGFQWLFISQFARAFPKNENCGPNISCSEAFKGSLLFEDAYNISNFYSKDWKRVLDYYLSADRANLFGLDTYFPDIDAGSYMGLGYDAVWLFAETLNHIISRQLTATGGLISQELRKIKFQGLSGSLYMNSAGDRTGFMGVIKVIDFKSKNNFKFLRFVKHIEPDSRLEYKYGIEPKHIDPVSNLSLIDIALPVSDVYNLRTFTSYSGGIDLENYRMIEDKSEPWPSKRIYRFEKVVPPFTCKNSCGKRVAIEDVNLYDRGKCIAMDNCECFLGYYGKRCEKIMCICQFGFCLQPFKCKCTHGWSGQKCDKPICSFSCSHGKCTEPERCKCVSSAWVNSTCSIHIASIIVPLVIILALLIYFAYIGSFWLRRYLERKAALSDLSWLVRWTDVTKVDTGTSKVSVHTELYSWNKEKWHVKNFNSKTVDLDDARIRFDMVELITIHHKNLIVYGGACLTYPNVCLLLEPAHKGSLEDILINESIQLGWDFRFSFMKDICEGMNFLHTKTEINSHGRLKSSNCLLDNRWTVRLSGFGVPTLRYGPYSILTDADDPIVYQENQMSLLWTAPELLETASNLNDVRSGTKEGDVYSFGIIISEIATRNVPFGHERNFLSIFSILDLIVDKDNPALANEREVWTSIGGDLFCIRPQITSEQLPEEKAVKKKFRKMLDDIWCEEPTARLTFHKLISILNNIYPSKGELMDNLINLLESYSNNLEHVVVERTNDLEIEKTKIDNIISQMLPKQVVESLKCGEKVQPEIFDNVTVFYSDIVGFTTIARKSKPMQVVDLLNELYGKFDGVLAQYDVYKVETIGDAYVVSSGVPTRNGNLHAGEIATASIDIVCTIMTVPIPHLPDDKLLLRMGIHSGSVVAGVVGLKMPRYTLFGETMQIAANLEATSKPLHIQVSKYTINILNEIGGYSYKLRGDREVCGRTITTYWLLGKAGYEKTLPDVEEN